MSVEGRYFTWTLAAGEDLDDLMPGPGHIFKAVALDDGKIAQDGREAGGILLYGFAGALVVTSPVGRHRNALAFGRAYMWIPSADGRVRKR